VKSLADQLASYEAYHRNPANKLTHFFGVPLVTFALFVALGWLRLAPAPELPITGATLFYLGVFAYYLRLDWRMALVQVPVTLALLAAADAVSRWPFGESAVTFLGTFVGGWAIQLAGHAVEGRRPALADNLLQVFNAPLFLAAEAAFALGYRRDLAALIGTSWHADKNGEKQGEVTNTPGRRSPCPGPPTGG
jgi:uncharacterized membrane protein YGL010W